MSCALLDSPSALITALFLSCSAFSTINLALSASCAATCLASIAAVNSFPKVRVVMDTSSSAMSKLAALSVKIFRISLLTAYKKAKIYV
uniref:Prohibitin n=1 Tax=Rhizophora mucronata TaxID=61149 RepID=A0A2P2L4L3_RHIMU